MNRNIDRSPPRPIGTPMPAAVVSDPDASMRPVAANDTTFVAGTPGEFMASDEAINKLNECLRGELSAVETYDLAMRSARDLELVSALRELRDSHDRRVALLRDRIRAWGAEPVQTSGAWGAFARLVQRGADLFGDSAAMVALEEGEDRGIHMYADDLDHLDAKTRDFLVLELLPEQEKTHELCGALERFVKAA
jgi:demethoxyubiquinone hydroxylase (CLK1/Coq7/Cat5 family)